MLIDDCKTGKIDADAMIKNFKRQAVNLYNIVSISLVRSPAEHSATKVYVER